MGIAVLAKKRSKDPICQVGACIVDSDNKIVGVGYNGMPIGCDDDEMPWGKGNKNVLKNKTLYVCHAEPNAIIFSGKDNLQGCTIYVTRIPCNNCAKIVIQSGIKEVVYLDDPKKPEDAASRRLFKKTGVALSEYKPTGRVISFEV